MFILLRLIWPYVFRLVMKQASENAAAYLEARRQKRYGTQQNISAVKPDDEIMGIDDEPFDQPLQLVCDPPPSPSFFNSDAFWFTLSGIVLGIAMSIVAAVIKRAIGKPQ